MRVGGLGGSNDFLLGCIGLAVSDVITDGSGKQQRFLQHQTNLAAQAVQRDIAHIMPINRDAPAGHVIKARDQVDDTAFPAARRPHNANHLIGLCLKCDVTKRFRPVFAVLQTYILKADMPLDAREGLCARVISENNRLIEGLENAAGAAGSGAKLLDDEAQTLNGICQQQNIAVERDNRSDGEGMVDDLGSALPEHQRCTYRDQKRHNRKVGAPGVGKSHLIPV